MMCKIIPICSDIARPVYSTDDYLRSRTATHFLHTAFSPLSLHLTPIKGGEKKEKEETEILEKSAISVDKARAAAAAAFRNRIGVPKLTSVRPSTALLSSPPLSSPPAVQIHPWLQSRKPRCSDPSIW